MKKKVLLSLMSVFAAFTVNAAPITCKQAAKNVREFLNGRMALKFASAPIKTVSQNDGEIQPYYIFNVGNDGGFVIASGDDATYSILGYSYEGSIDINNIPENMQVWLDGYAREIKHIQKLNLPVRMQKKAANETKRNIPALLSTMWDQGFPYNKFTPDFNDGYGNRPTGCVATAMSQVMNFHQWPMGETAKVAEYTFEDTYSGGDGKLKTVSALEPTTFEWDVMLDSYSEDSNERAANAVAELMNYVGRSVKMVYGPYSSGAYATDMIPALVNVFGYKNSAKLEYKEYFSQEGWNDMVYNELANNRPVVYFGATKSMMGHQFVCDGYENEFFHINWGWSGRSDGFFKLSVLNPEDQGTGGAGDGMSFSEYQNAIFGLEKPVTEDKLYGTAAMAAMFADVDVKVRFDNFSAKYVSAEFDITLPEGYSIVDDEAVFSDLRSEKADHVVKVTKTAEGKYHFSISSASNSKIIVSAGELLRMKVKPSSSVTEDIRTAILSNIVLKDANNAETKLADSSFDFNSYKVTEALTGDANKDGVVDAVDVNTIVDYIMYKFPKPFDFSLADVNADGMIDAADVMAVTDIMLVNSGSERNIVETEIDDKDTFAFTYNEKGIEMLLNNTTGYKALQMDVIVTSDIQFTEILPNEVRAEGFDIAYTKIADGRYRMVMYSSESKNLKSNEGAVVSFVSEKLPEEVKLTSIVMVTSDLRRTTLSDVDCKLPTGIKEISSENNGNIIYTLEGVRVNNNINSLQRGIYVVNGKKVIVR